MKVADADIVWEKGETILKIQDHKNNRYEILFLRVLLSLRILQFL